VRRTRYTSASASLVVAPSGAASYALTGTLRAVGIHVSGARLWIPAFAGMTQGRRGDARLSANDIFNSLLSD